MLPVRELPKRNFAVSRASCSAGQRDKAEYARSALYCAKKLSGTQQIFACGVDSNGRAEEQTAVDRCSGYVRLRTERLLQMAIDILEAEEYSSCVPECQ